MCSALFFLKAIPAPSQAVLLQVVCVRAEELPIGGDLTDEQAAWKKYSFDVYDEVKVEEITDSHGG